MAEVVLIRPGSTDFDEQKRVQGSLDLPLSSRGQAQVEDILARLQEIPLEVIYAPASEPARATAEAIAADLNVPLKESKDLRNLNQGLWQGMQIDEIRRKYPKVFKQWQESPQTICPPEGEPIPEAMDRIRRALQKPLKRKVSFAIVASEPLATLISCVIRNCKPEIPGSVYGPREVPDLEILHNNGALQDAAPEGAPETANRREPALRSKLPARGGHSR